MKKEGKHKYVSCKLEVVEFQVERNFATGMNGFYQTPISNDPTKISFDMYVHQQLNPKGDRNANAFGTAGWSDKENQIW